MYVLHKKKRNTKKYYEVTSDVTLLDINIYFIYVSWRTTYWRTETRAGIPVHGTDEWYTERADWEETFYFHL